MLSYPWCRSGFLSVRKKVGKTAAFAAAFPTLFRLPLLPPLHCQTLQTAGADQPRQLLTA